MVTGLENPVRAMLLARLAGDEVPAPSMPTASPMEMLLSAIESDPDASDVAEALRRRAARERATRESDSLLDPGSEPVDPSPTTVEHRGEGAADAAEVLAVIQGLHAELTAARDLLSQLGAALGACARCFGHDPACAVCHGRGVPGARAPDPAGFAAFIRPVLRRGALEKPTSTTGTTTIETTEETA